MTPYRTYPDCEIWNGNNVDVMREQLRDGAIDLTVTSPPYDDLRTYKTDQAMSELWSFNDVAEQLWRVTKQGGMVVWIVADATSNGSESGTSFRQALRFMEIGFLLHDTMIYETDKPPLTHNRYEQSFEYMFCFAKGKPSTFNAIKRKATCAGHLRTGKFVHTADAEYKYANTPGRTGDAVMLRNVWYVPTGGSKETKGHTAAFPEALVRDHILSWSNEGDTVLDCFAGTFTTCKQARLLGRRSIGIEVNKEYCEIGVRRMRQPVLPLGE